MKPVYYLLVDPSHSDNFVWVDDDAVAKSFDTEAEAIACAKENELNNAHVVKSVARVMQKTTCRVERFK